MLNNNLFIFLHNSYVIKFDTMETIQDIYKLPNKLGSSPIFINESILYLNNKNRLVVLN